MRTAPIMPNTAARTSEQSIAEKKVDLKFCCACCISEIPGCAVAPNARRQQQRVTKDDLMLKADAACIDNGFLFGQAKEVGDRHPTSAEQFIFVWGISWCGRLGSQLHRRNLFGKSQLMRISAGNSLLFATRQVGQDDD